MNKSNSDQNMLDELRPSTSSETRQFSSSDISAKATPRLRRTGVSEFFTNSYAKLPPGFVRQWNPNEAPKNYYLFDKNDKLQVYQTVDPSLINKFYKMQQDFTLKEGVLVYLAAERFNDPAMAKLDGRTAEECVQIFTKIVSDPQVFDALQKAFLDMPSKEFEKLMSALPFAPEEDEAIKKLLSDKDVSERALHDLQKKSLPYFRGRKAIKSRYFHLFVNSIKGNNKKVYENRILPSHDKLNATNLKYLSACAVPELNETLTVSKNITALTARPPPEVKIVFGTLCLQKDVLLICNETFYVYAENGKMRYQSQFGRNLGFHPYIIFKIENETFTVLNSFGISIFVNDVQLSSGHAGRFPHVGTFVIKVPRGVAFAYVAKASSPSDKLQTTNPKSEDTVTPANNPVRNNKKDLISETKLPSDYLAFQRYMKDEMAEKMKLSKYLIETPFSLFSAKIVGDDSGYNEGLSYYTVPPQIAPTRKGDDDIRFITSRTAYIKDDKMKCFGLKRPILKHTAKTSKRFPPTVSTMLGYNEFNSDCSLLTSFTPGIPRNLPAFKPKPKLVRNELGHPVWVNVSEKPSPPKQATVLPYGAKILS